MLVLPVAAQEAGKQSKKEQRRQRINAIIRQEEEGVISDGKTPLSTLSLEDVVLDTRMNAGGSSRDFERRHHGARIGNTTGHTNS